MVLNTTILRRLKEQGAKDEDLRFYDIRYLHKWVRLYPLAFNKFILKGNYTIKFSYIKLRWEFHNESSK